MSVSRESLGAAIIKLLAAFGSLFACLQGSLLSRHNLCGTCRDGSIYAGVISGELFYLAKREGPELLISPALHWFSSIPTVVAALAYLLTQAVQDVGQLPLQPPTVYSEFCCHTLGAVVFMPYFVCDVMR